MGWPVINFDNVRFNQDGVGWAVSAAIYEGIRERAIATLHSLAATYSSAADFDFWQADTDGDTGREYLVDWLRAYYDDIALLVSGDANIRWTVASGAGTTWTMAALVTDIDMGDFADLVNRSADPTPFIWLQAALDRLLYPQVLVPVSSGAGTFDTSESTTTDGSFTLQDYWDLRAESVSPSAIGSGCSLKWDVSLSQARARLFKNYEGLTFPTADYLGTLVEAYYKYSWLWNNVTPATSIEVEVGTESFTATGTDAGGFQLTTDVVIGANTVVDANFVTAEPSTVPFSGFLINSGFLEFLCSAVRIHTDLSSVLTDQA